MRNRFARSIKNVSPGAWARLALLIITLANAFLTAAGKNPLSAFGEAGEITGLIAVTLSAAAAYWHNNSFTEAAQVADRVMRELKEVNNNK